MTSQRRPTSAELEHALRAALAEVKADTIKWVAGLLLDQPAGG